MPRKQPPTFDPILDERGNTKPSWIEFFENMYAGDRGAPWTPTFTNLTQVGTPTITGRYFKLGSGLVYFWVKIVPGTSTSSTAGTTFINNFPLNITNNGACFAVSNGLGGSAGHALEATHNIYPPAWTGLTNTVTIVGLIEAS